MSVIDEVKSRLDIVDIVSETVTLKKSGQSYLGFCPFHSNTKTPSFVVFPHTQTWRCFGACAEGGDLFSYVIKREGCDFKEALTLLAQRAGVTLTSPTPEASRQEAEQQKLLELNAAAALYFHHLLMKSSAGALTRHYLTQRALTTETVITFQLGYAPHDRDALQTHFIERGYSLAELIAVGLVIQPDDGTASYDRFRHRLMIPIRNPKGQVIGFGARALAENQQPKYLNSPQTALFDKSATLFGLDLARQSIQRENQVVIVEGYMDVIQAFQRGARNVVAQMGTALTEPQLKLIAGRNTKIVLALDSDEAGKAATLRNLQSARQWLPKKNRPSMTAHGIDMEAYSNQELYVALLPNGQDPDDVLKQGLTAWQALMQAALPVLDFYEQIILRQAHLQTPQGKAQVVHELMPIYREIEDEIEKVARVQQLARTIGLDERLLMAELKNGTAAPASSTSPPTRLTLNSKIPPVEAPKPPQLGLEDYCLSLIIAHPIALATANDLLEQHQILGLTSQDFNQSDNKEIFHWLQLWTAAEVPRFETLLDMVGDLFQPKLKYLATQWPRQVVLPIEKICRDLSAAILRIRLQNVIKHIEEITFLQSEMLKQSDVQAARGYTSIVEDYKQQRKKLEMTQGALSVNGQILARTPHHAINNKPFNPSRIRSY